MWPAPLRPILGPPREGQQQWQAHRSRLKEHPVIHDQDGPRNLADSTLNCEGKPKHSYCKLRSPSRGRHVASRLSMANPMPRGVPPVLRHLVGGAVPPDSQCVRKHSYRSWTPPAAPGSPWPRLSAPGGLSHFFALAGFNSRTSLSSPSRKSRSAAGDAVSLRRSSRCIATSC
jgi:hypothetical protein